MRRSLRRCRGALWLALAALAALPALAEPPEAAAPSAAQEPDAAEEGDNYGHDFTRPLNLFQLRYEYKTQPGSGSEPGTTREVTSDIVAARLDHKIELAPHWEIGLRSDLPVLWKNPVTASNPAGNYQFGLGDVDVQAALLYGFDENRGWGVGARLIAPTATDDLGSGKWQIMPGVALRFVLPDLGSGSYAVPLLRYDVSFAGNPARRNISNLQFAPTLTIGLPDHWFFTLYPSPDIRVNFGPSVPGQTGPLFLPIDVMAGRKVTPDLVLSFELGVPIVNNYPVYDFKLEARINRLF